MQPPPAKLALSVHFGGIRRNPCTQSKRLITRRSQVQFLPPLLRKAPETAPFASVEPREFSVRALPSGRGSRRALRPLVDEAGRVARGIPTLKARLVHAPPAEVLADGEGPRG